MPPCQALQIYSHNEMKRFRNLLIVCLPFLLLASAADAQPYHLGGGLRLGEWYGLQGKIFVSDSKAFELIVSPVTRGMHLSLLAETHTSAFGQKGLLAFIGLGPHIALWSDGRYNAWWNDDWKGGNPRNYYNRSGDPAQGRIALGLDMIMGLEYTIPSLPLSIALDWKPGVMLLGNPGLILNDVALSLRFIQ